MEKTMLHHTLSSRNAVVSSKKSEFASKEELISMELPDSISIIKEVAFTKCFELRNILIPKSIKSID